MTTKVSVGEAAKVPLEPLMAIVPVVVPVLVLE
jgi:hypothetical protein